MRGTRTAAGGFALTGRLLSLHRPSGARELRQRVRPFRAGSFSLNLSGGFAVCGRRERAAPRGGDDAVPTAVGKKEGQPAVFLPL